MNTPPSVHDGSIIGLSLSLGLDYCNDKEIVIYCYVYIEVLFCRYSEFYNLIYKFLDASDSKCR